MVIRFLENDMQTSPLHPSDNSNFDKRITSLNRYQNEIFQMIYVSMLWNEILLVCWGDEKEELCNAIIHARTLARLSLLWRSLPRAHDEDIFDFSSEIFFLRIFWDVCEIFYITVAGKKISIFLPMKAMIHKMNETFIKNKESNSGVMREQWFPKLIHRMVCMTIFFSWL